MIGIIKMVSQMRRYYCRNTAENLEVRVIRKNHFQKTRQFLETFFYNQDPLHSCIKLYQHENSISALERYIEDTIKSELSIMMLNQQKNIVGLCLNRLMKENQGYGKIEDKTFKKIIDLLDAIDVKCNLFQKFGVNQYVKLENLIIDPTAEKTGIEKKLLDVTKYLAQQNDMRLMRMDCTSQYNVNLASKLGFIPVYNLKYENYTLNDRPVFKPQPPHTEFSVFVQTIEPEMQSLRDKHLGRRIPSKPVKEYF